MQEIQTRKAGGEWDRSFFISQKPLLLLKFFSDEQYICTVYVLFIHMQLKLYLKAALPEIFLSPSPSLAHQNRTATFSVRFILLKKIRPLKTLGHYNKLKFRAYFKLQALSLASDHCDPTICRFANTFPHFTLLSFSLFISVLFPCVSRCIQHFLCIICSH